MKKVISLILVVAMLFSFTCISVSAEGESETPRLSFTEEITLVATKSHMLTSEDGSGFKVSLNTNNKNLVAFDGFSRDYTATIVSIQAQKDGDEKITYDENYVSDPDAESSINPFFEYFAVPEGEARKDVAIYVTIKVDFVDAEVFGDLGYEVSISGFSAPPNLGELGSIIGGDSLPIPTTITATGNISNFPKLKSSSLKVINASEKQLYLDSEYPELEGTSLELTSEKITYDSEGKVISSTDLYTGTVTYGPQTAHMFTTIPEKNEKVAVGTTEIVTSFSGIQFSIIPVSVDHDWSKNLVSITTDKYSANKPGYHAYVCNGCGKAHSREEHHPEIELDAQGNPILDENGNEVQKWTSNEDASFVGNGTASSTCQDCGATLTKDVHGSAGFNTAFENYHFLLVIFEYINLILRFIGTAVG